jgi:hypothetical protein
MTSLLTNTALTQAIPDLSNVMHEGYRRNKERGRQRKRWKDEVEEDLNIMGIKNGSAAARDRRKWRKTLLQAKVHNGMQRLRRRRSRMHEGYQLNYEDSFSAFRTQVTYKFRLRHLVHKAAISIATCCNHTATGTHKAHHALPNSNCTVRRQFFEV